MPGNNSEVVKKCLEQRTYWKECTNPNTEFFNFKWKETSYGIDFANLSKITVANQMTNHFEYHTQISNKHYLFINLLKYCEVIIQY